MMGVPLTGNWSKSSVAPIFDHSWKISYPGVAQLVARLLWEQEARGSSSCNPTTFCRKLPFLAVFCVFFVLFNGFA